MNKTNPGSVEAAIINNSNVPQNKETAATEEPKTEDDQTFSNSNNNNESGKRKEHTLNQTELKERNHIIEELKVCYSCIAMTMDLIWQRLFLES